MIMQSEDRKKNRSWIFWSSTAGIALCGAASLFPAFHLPKWIFSFILIASLSALLLHKNRTTLQVIFATLVGVIASGFGIYYTWNDPIVILIVPGFLFMLLFLVVLTRVLLRRRALLSH
jgi:hypothetical protein